MLAPEAVKVSVLVVVAGLGLKSAVTPLGTPEADSVTGPLKPWAATMVMVLVIVPVCGTVTWNGLGLRVKKAPENEFMRPEPLGDPQPVAGS